MKYPRPVILVQFIVSLLSSFVFAQTTGKPLLIKPFENKVFIKELGQFSRNSKELKIPFAEPVLYGVENAEFNAYFTAHGIIFQFPERRNVEEKDKEKIKEEKKRTNKKEKDREKEEAEEKTVETIWHSTTMRWLNTDPSAELFSEQKVPDYYNYDGSSINDTAINFVPAYKKLKYINLYPGVDAEFELSEAGGIKYKFIVHPNVIVPTIAFQWEGIEKVFTDAIGDLHINTVFGPTATNTALQLIDHAPNAFTSSSHTNIPLKYSVTGNVVQFDLSSQKTSSPEGIVIDPWITNTTYPTTNRAYDIQEDAAGNVFVHGNTTSYHVEKYSPAGILIWSYITSSTFLGDIAVDNPGNIYIVGGYSAGKRQKLNPAGVQQWVFSGLSEEWRLAFNYSKTVLTVGGYFIDPGGNNLGKFNTSTGAITNEMVYNLETRSIATDCNGDMFSLHITFGTTGTPAGNILNKTNANFTPGGSVGSGFLLTEREAVGVGYAPNPTYSPGIFQGFNGVAVNGPYVYIYDGATLRRVNKTTLTIINSVTVPGGSMLMCSGIATDLCGDIYVGTQSGMVKYDPLLNYIATISAPGAVYDIILSSTGNLLACGAGFLGNFSTTCISPPLFSVTLSSVNATCNGGSATALATGGTAPYAYSWTPGGQITSTATNLAAGSYTCTVNDAFCHSFTGPITVNQTAPLLLSPGGVTNESCLNSFNGSATVTALGGSSPYSFTWNTSPVQHTQTATGLSAGTYLAIVVDADSCRDTVTVVITRNSNPVAAFSNTAVCNGNSTQFTDGSTSSSGTINSWAWNFGDGSPVNTTPSPGHTYTNPGFYSVLLTVVSTFGCVDTSMRNILVHPLPHAQFDTIVVCRGDTVQFNDQSIIASPDLLQAWTWNFGDGSPVSHNQNPSHFFNTPGTYNVKLVTVSGFGCPDSITHSVTIVPTLTAEAGFGSNSFCSGGVVLLGGSPTATGGIPPYTYSWAPAAGLNNSILANPFATITGNITYSVTITDVTGCHKKDTVRIIFNPNGPFADAGFGNNTLCTGGTILLGGAPTGSGGTPPYSYSWIPVSGLNNPASANPTATLTGNITYRVTVSDLNGCMNIDSVHITYNPSGPFADAGFGSNTLCTGGTLLLGGAPTASGGTGPYTYSWAPSTGLNNSALANPTAIVAANITYVVTVTDALGCQNIDSVHVIYNPNGPHSVAGFGNSPICTGGNIVLGGAPTVTGGTPPYTYSWLPATGLSNPASANPMASVTANIIYVLNVTDASGCHDIDSVSVLFSANGPHVDAGFGNNTLCTGGSILLGGTPTATGGTGPYTYTWAPSIGLNNAGSSNPIAVITTNASYSVTVMDAVGCQNIDTVHLNYIPSGPHAEAGFSQNSLCTGGTILLGGAPTSMGGSPPYTYSWLPALGLNHNNIANPVATVTTNTNYVIIVTDGNGCQDIDSVDISYNSTGPFADAGSGNSAFCYGQNLLLGGFPTGSGGTLPYTYSWVPAGGLNNSNLANPAAINVTANTVYYLTITDAAGCTNLDSTVVNIIGTGITANFSANPTGGADPLLVHFTNQSIGSGLTYQWFFGDNDTSTVIHPNHTFHNLGSDTVAFSVLLVATDVNGCKDTATFKVHANPSSFLDHPNVFTPNGDGVNDVFYFNSLNIKIVSASIFNRWGEKMYEWSAPLSGWDGRTASGVLASSGIYFFIFNAIGIEGKTYNETGYILLAR